MIYIYIYNVNFNFLIVKWFLKQDKFLKHVTCFEIRGEVKSTFEVGVGGMGQQTIELRMLLSHTGIGCNVFSL